MTRLWRRCAYDRVLVLTILILVRSSWTLVRRDVEEAPGGMASPANGFRSSEAGEEELEVVIGTSADANTLQYYLTHWNESGEESSGPSPEEEEAVYYGEGLADVIFHSSAENNSLILADLTRCLNDFGLVTCLKFLLLSKLDNTLSYLDENDLMGTDLSFMDGAVSFKRVRTGVTGEGSYEGRTLNEGSIVGLDEDITRKVMLLFGGRSLYVNLLPCLGVEVTPVPKNSTEDFIDFKARTFINWTFWRNDAEPGQSAGRGSGGKRGKGGMKMPSMMMLPQLIMWGFMPFALANLQAMVMNAFMLNMMALNSAIFMTIRNLVFGPRGGPKIKYVNYGYRKKKKSTVPTIIVHSPAAFVKQPFHKFRRHKRPIHSHGPPKGTPPHHHHHHHYEIHDGHPSGHAHYSDESPTSYSEVYQSAEPTGHFQSDYEQNDGGLFEEHHAVEYGHADENDHHRRENGVQVIKEDGELDGKNRVRIRIRSGGIASMKELLHRVRSIEEKAKRTRFSPPDEYEVHHGTQDVPETVSNGHSRWQPSHEVPSSSLKYVPLAGSDIPASHNLNIHSSGSSDGGDHVINYDKDQFIPMVKRTKQAIGR